MMVFFISVRGVSVLLVQLTKSTKTHILVQPNMYSIFSKITKQLKEENQTQDICPCVVLDLSVVILCMCLLNLF